MSTTLRAEFFFDDEASTWHYRVPALHINGGGMATREDASVSAWTRSRLRWRATRASTTATPRRSPSRCPSLLPPDPRLLRMGHCLAMLITAVGLHRDVESCSPSGHPVSGRYVQPAWLALARHTAGRCPTDCPIT
jgi:hypothetical protein